MLKTQVQLAVAQIVRDYMGGIELQEEEPGKYIYERPLQR